MSTTQETSVTSSQDRCEAVEGTKINGETEAEFNGGKSTIEELFPWIIEFKRKCRSLLAQPNIVALIKLMKFYARNVSINVNECYTKPYRAAKLKDSISETLLFFLFYFRELVEVCDKNSYLDKMSDLLAMYLDMELKASRRGKEHHSKIAARLTSCLYVYLENSIEHILDTFIKARFINRNYQEILDPVLTKISKNLPVQPNCDTMYVRYLLIYRLWKKVNNDAAVKNQINATAVLHLGPPPPSPTPFLAKYVLPKVPKSQANSTKFLLLHKFDIEKSCRLFIQYCKENREDEEQGDLDKPNFIPNTISSVALDTLGASGMTCRGTNQVDNLIDNVNILSEAEKRQRNPIVKTNCNNSGENCATRESTKLEKHTTKNESGEISPLKPLRPVKGLGKLKTKKTGDILFIDLTEDEITEKVIKKKKHRKLHWLTEVKKKLNSKSIKAAEKKKKTQTIAKNLSEDITLSGLVDSTSAGSFSNATTPEPKISSEIDSKIGKSLSTATTPEPENCVTSNFAENDLTLELNSVNSSDNGIPNFVEKQPSCDVTTTVTESVPVTTDKLEQIIFNSNDPASSFNQTIDPTENSCHTTSEQDQMNSQNPKAWAVSELSSALSHICDSYDSDNSAMDTSGNDNRDFKLNDKAETKTVGTTDVVKSKGIIMEPEKSLDRKESDKALEKSQRSSSESSEVAVIFTRRASDVEIVNLDDYAEDNNEQITAKGNSPCLFTASTVDKDNKQFGGTDSPHNSETCDVKDLTLRTNQLKLTSSLENLNARKCSGKKISGDDNLNETKKLAERITGSVEEKSSNIANALESIYPERMRHEVKFEYQTNIGRSIGAEGKIQLQMNESQNQQNTLGKLETTKLVDCNIEKYCDYKSSKNERVDDVQSTLANDLEIAKKGVPGFVEKQTRREIVENKASSIQDEYIVEQISIPKMNEILICSKNGENTIHNISNDLLKSQQPQFNENIDGLSLLASVSQHVSHLEEYSEKLLSKPKNMNGKVPCNNSGVKNSLKIDSVIKDIGDVDSYELLLDLNVGASTEIIGVPHRINDNKINEAENFERESPDITENDSSDVVPLILETTVDLNSSTLHNNLISVENVTQMIKESTNVIVNGETVVLFQKSPNSNLYIINKAADGTMECLGDNKKSGNKNIERNSTTMRDIINHIPINLSEKNGDRQDGGKTHRCKTSGSNKNKKVDNYTRRHESQVLTSKQFKPIREEFSQYGDKLEDEYIKKEILNTDSYEDSLGQRCTDTPGSVIELEPVQKSPPPIIRLTDTPIDVRMLTNRKEIYSQESTAMNMTTTTTTGRSNGHSRSYRREEKGEGTSNENLKYKQIIKQEFRNSNDTLNTNSDSQQVAKQNYANINTGNLFSVKSILSPKIPHVYSAVATATNLYNIEQERCGYPSCSLKANTNQSYQSVPQSVSTCQLSHCACMKCAYEVHCAQCVQGPAATAAHPSYIQTNSYFLSTDSTAEPCPVQERESKMNEAVLAKLHDDQLLHNIEQSIIDNNQLNQGNVKTIPEIKYKPEFDNKLPLKKRLKAHAMLSMSYEGASIKIEKVENYPGTPMMSIAALETRNLPQNSPDGTLYEDKPSTALELSPRVKDDSLSHQTTEMIRRDYLKDTSLTSIGNCGNVDDRVKKTEQQRRQINSHVNIMGTGCQRSFKTPAQRKELVISSPTSLKRAATTTANNPKSPKKGKKAKTTGNGRQTRSSKRNIPKVDYSYDGIIDTDPKFNSLGELRRKRKKTTR